MSKADLAERVRQIRSTRRMTQVELAEETGYSPSSISKCENYTEGDGMTSVRIDIIEQMTGTRIEGPFYREATTTA